jgi:hypothetical protein
MQNLPSCDTSNEITKYSVTQLQNATYKLVWSVSGKDIYDDIQGPQNYFYNWGKYTNLYNHKYGYNCINEPTGTPCVYVDMLDAQELGLIQKVKDKIQIKAKMLPITQQRNEQPFASIRLHSTPSFTYGLMVYHITKIPDPKNYWSAAWLAAPFSCTNGDNGSKNKFGEWPASGEIDVMEYIGGNNNSISSLHVPCRHADDPIQVTRDKPIPFDKPGYFVLEWTPKYIKMYYLSEDEGKPFFNGKNSVNIADLQKYNATASTRCDQKNGTTSVATGWKNTKLPVNGGCDVTNGAVMMEVNNDSKNDKTWLRGGGVPPCELATGQTTEYKGDYLKQKKEAVMFPLGKHAVKAGGMVLILNIAVNTSCSQSTCQLNSNKFPTVFKDSCTCNWEQTGCCCKLGGTGCTDTSSGWNCFLPCRDYGEPGADGLVPEGVMEIADVQVFQIR